MIINDWMNYWFKYIEVNFHVYPLQGIIDTDIIYRHFHLIALNIYREIHKKYFLTSVYNLKVDGVRQASFLWKLRGAYLYFGARPYGFVQSGTSLKFYMRQYPVNDSIFPMETMCALITPTAVTHIWNKPLFKIMTVYSLPTRYWLLLGLF